METSASRRPRATVLSSLAIVALAAMLAAGACGDEFDRDIEFVAEIAAADPLREVAEKRRVRRSVLALVYQEIVDGSYGMYLEASEIGDSGTQVRRIYLLRHGIYLAGPMKSPYSSVQYMLVGNWRARTGGAFQGGVIAMDGFGKIEVQRQTQDELTRLLLPRDVGVLELEHPLVRGRRLKVRTQLAYRFGKSVLLDWIVELSSNAGTAGAVYEPNDGRYRRQSYWLGQVVLHVVRTGTDAALADDRERALRLYEHADMLSPSAETAIAVGLDAFYGGLFDVATEYVELAEDRRPSRYVQGQIAVLRRHLAELPAEIAPPGGQ